MKPLVHAPDLDIVLPIVEIDNDEIILSSVPAVSAVCGFGVGRRRILEGSPRHGGERVELQHQIMRASRLDGQETAPYRAEEEKP